MMRVATIGRLRLPKRLLSTSDPKEIRIDTSGLGKRADERHHDDDDETNTMKAPATPLAKALAAEIRSRGPVTTHEYMRQCLLHPTLGYYARDGADRAFGMEGDFVTAPELCQLFGDLIGVWLVSEWCALGEPRSFRLVEIGPGRGTLMADVLRATTAWPAFRSACREIDLVEPSPSLRAAQQRELLATTHEENEEAWQLPDSDRYPCVVRWHDSLGTVPTVGPTFFLGQEVLDAFPAHQFVLTEAGWREKLVDIDADPMSTSRFRWVLAPTATPASATLTLRSPALATMPLPTSQLNEALTLEYAPSALAFVDDIANRVKSSNGAGLFIDYGKFSCLGDTLRAFKRHAQVSPFSDPGLVDMTVDVDFKACARQAALVDNVKVFGPVPQGEWLGRMGIVHRLQALLDHDKVSETDMDTMITACERLCDPAHMGERYKVLTIVHDRWSSEYSLDDFPPGGFLPDDIVHRPESHDDVVAP